MIDTAALRKLLAETTQGEWRSNTSHPVKRQTDPKLNEWRDYVQQDCRHCVVSNGPNAGHVSHAHDFFPVQALIQTATRTADAAFIAAAHNTMPALLDELDRLRAFVVKKGVIFDSEMCDGDYRCLSCKARAYDTDTDVQHAPGCIVAEARNAHRAS